MTERCYSIESDQFANECKVLLTSNQQNTKITKKFIITADFGTVVDNSYVLNLKETGVEFLFVSSTNQRRLLHNHLSETLKHNHPQNKHKTQQKSIPYQ